MYNEIGRLFLHNALGKSVDKSKTSIKTLQNHIIYVGIDTGFIEYANYAGLITSDTQIDFICTPKAKNYFETYLATDTLGTRKVTYTGTLSNNTIYTLLNNEFATSADILIFNYYSFVNSVEFNFSYIQNTSNIIGMLFSLKNLNKGGTLIIHLYSIINKRKL